MVQEVVRQVVANVAEDATTVDCGSSIPIVAEDGMCQFPKWRGQHDKQRRRHDQSVLVHGKIVVDSMKQKVQSNEYAVIREVTISVVSNQS